MNVDCWEWEGLCQQLGLKCIKREGTFNLIESGVINDISGKYIVILNDELDDKSDDENDFKQALDYLDPVHFYQAVNYHNIKFFIIGANVDE